MPKNQSSKPKTRSSRKKQSPVSAASPTAAATVPQPPMVTVPKKRLNAAAVRRRKHRDRLWRNADDVVWDRRTEKGFTTVPRTLPLICTLIKYLTNNGDASRAYLDLWGRVYDEGIVEIVDEAECALSSGYGPGTRNVRTWQERMSELRDLGFIAVRPKPTRTFGYILLVHPHMAVARLLDTAANRVPDWWKELYVARLREIGASRRSPIDLDDFIVSANGALSTIGTPEDKVEAHTDTKVAV